MKVCSVSEMREMDRRAIEELGIPEAILMENAGRAAFEVLRREWGVAGRRYAILCGVGNNGGDGFVVARMILAGGGTPRVFVVGDPAKYRGAAKENLALLGRLPLQVTILTDAGALGGELRAADGIVDALFGTGLDRAVGGLFREVIERVNGAGRPVLSLDIPSGVHGDSGLVLGAAVRADHTVTFGLPKTGNMLPPGCGLGGRLHLCPISMPPSLRDDPAIAVGTNDPVPLPPRDPEAHKGSVGDVLFIAGAAAYYGAPYFAAMSLLKAGGGYSRLAAPWSMIPHLATRGSEIVFVPQAETADKGLSLKNRDALLELSRKVDMVVVGPGLSQAAETMQLVRELAAGIEKPLLIDGDGIAAVAGHPEILRGRVAPTILTPHPGEMARLSGEPVSEIRGRRIPILRRCCAELNGWIVLKGARSLVGAPDGRVFVNLSGNPGMATAGSGDLLTGTIAAMHGLGLAVGEAVCKGVFLHGLAGDLAALRKGEDGMTAQDILDSLPAALRQDREGIDGRLAWRYAGAAIV